MSTSSKQGKVRSWCLLVPVLTFPLLLSSCAGQQLLGKVNGTQTRLQDAIANGSKTIGCAPKETALAEANIKFAEEALKMGEYYRGKEHVILAGKYTEIAELKTDPVRCHRQEGPIDAPPPGADDRDRDGLDDDVDECPDKPEDFDDFEDKDGCPDLDNDGDGVQDAVDYDPESRTYSNADQKTDPETGQPIDCRNEPEDPDGFEDEDGCPDPDNDQDGMLDAEDGCPNEPEDFDNFEDEDGCPDPDNDQDKILDVDDKCPDEPEDYDGKDDEDGCYDPDAKINSCSIDLDGKIQFENAEHSLDWEKYREHNYKLLDDLVRTLDKFKDITLEIGGHTSSKGRSKYNQKLSERRVKSVRDYLVSKGVDPSRLTYKGYGEDVPIESNRTKKGREANRRVEFIRTDNPECKR